jgi:hypothetical protein
MTDESGVPASPAARSAAMRSFGARREGSTPNAGATADKVELLVCLRCSNFLLSYEGYSIFDFD